MTLVWPPCPVAGFVRLLGRGLMVLQQRNVHLAARVCALKIPSSLRAWSLRHQNKPDRHDKMPKRAAGTPKRILGFSC